MDRTDVTASDESVPDARMIFRMPRIHRDVDEMEPPPSGEGFIDCRVDGCGSSGSRGLLDHGTHGFGDHRRDRLGLGHVDSVRAPGDLVRAA